MKILVVDDKRAWIDRGVALLEPEGHKIVGLLVTNPVQYTSECLITALEEILQQTEVLLVDDNFGEGITSTRFICVVRSLLPKLKVIRWANQPTERHFLYALGVSCIDKPTKRTSGSCFLEHFNTAIENQKLIMTEPMGIFRLLSEMTDQQKGIGQREEHLRILSQIAMLADSDEVGLDQWLEYPLKITGREGNVTRQKLSQCICDGYLSEEDIRPLLPNLQRVVKKFREAGEINEDFLPCAELIESGRLGELELVHFCY